MTAELVAFPEVDVRDIERGLQKLLDDIGDGKYGAAHNVVWVVDCGDGKIDFGMLGSAAEPGAVAYFLMAMAMQKLASAVAESD